LVFETKADAAEFTGPFRIVAISTINGQEVKREVRAATVTWAGPQNNPNFPLIARLDQEFVLAVREKANFSIRIDPAKITKGKDKVTLPIAVKPGEKLNVPIDIVRQGPETKVAITAAFVISQRNNMGQPGNQPALSMNNGQPNLTIPADKNEGSFPIDIRNGAAPGIYPVVVRAYAQVPYDKSPEGKNKKPTIFTAVSQPFAIQVLPASIGKLAVTVPGSAKQGAELSLVAKMTRESDFEGEYRLKLVLPPNTKGIEAKEVTLPAGQTEVKFPIVVSKDANPATYSNLTIEAVGKYEGKHEYKTEAKFNLQVAKDK
jgi:hypothetical protein